MSNNSRKILMCFTCLLFVSFAFSQKVEIIQKSELKNLPEGKKYAFIEPTTDTNNIRFVASILARGNYKESIIEKLYFAIRQRANKLGANCFKVKSFYKDTLKYETVLILDSYVATDTLLTENTADHEKNVVCVFGGERTVDKTFSFKVNDETKEIKPGTYFKYFLKEGEEVKLSKGGALGAAIWLNWEKDKQPVFLTLSGFGVSDLSEQPSNALAFNTGRINRINNISLGLLMTQLLNQGNP